MSAVMPAAQTPAALAWLLALLVNPVHVSRIRVADTLQRMKVMVSLIGLCSCVLAGFLWLWVARQEQVPILECRRSVNLQFFLWGRSCQGLWVCFRPLLPA